MNKTKKAKIKEIEDIFEVMSPEKIKEACEWLEFYDKHHYFPFSKET